MPRVDYTDLYDASTTVTQTINAGTTGTAANYVWKLWNTSYAASATTASVTYANTCGYGWPFYTTTTTANHITEYVWTSWNEQIERAKKHHRTVQRVTRRPTDEEVRAAVEREKAQREAYELQLQKANEAKQRAEDLLRAFLSPEQRDDLEKKNCFYVVVPGRGGKAERYRIDRGTHGNVKQVDEQGRNIRQFCVQPEGVPVGDSMLAQKLFLESSDETRDEFWKTANITTLMNEKAVPQHIPRGERRKYAAEHGLLH